MTNSSIDLTAANRAFFDDLAAKYDIKPWQKQLALQITNYIQQNLGFIGIPKHSDLITLLDYACGTDGFTRQRARSHSEIPSVRNARAIEGNLLTDEDPPLELNGPELHNFDIVAVGGGLHHFPDPTKAIGRLAQRLKVGGVLLISDFIEEEQGWTMPTGVEHTIHKHGFSEREMRELMEGHGLGAFGWREMPERLEMKLHEDKPVSRKGFLARAAKM